MVGCNGEEEDFRDEVRGPFFLFRIESIRSVLVGVYLGLIPHVNAGITVKICRIDSIDLSQLMSSIQITHEI